MMTTIKTGLVAKKNGHAHYVNKRDLTKKEIEILENGKMIERDGICVRARKSCGRTYYNATLATGFSW